MLRRFGTNFVVFSLAMDALVVVLALHLAAWLRPDLSWLPFSQRINSVYDLPTPLVLAITLIWVVVLFLYSLYDPRQSFRIGGELRILLQGSCLAGLASAGLLYVAARDISRWTFLIFLAMAFAVLFAWRITARFAGMVLDVSPSPVRRVLVVGAGPIGQRIARTIALDQRSRLTFLGYVDDDRSPEDGRDAVLGSVAGIRALCQIQRVDEVVIAPPYSYTHLDEILESLLDLPLHVRIAPAGVTQVLSRTAIENFGGVPLIDLRDGPLSEYQRVLKRILDLVVGSLLTLLALPVMGVIAIIVSHDGEGAVLFEQLRVGENGRPFVMYKFRTMIDGAEKLQAQVITWDAEGRLVHKHPNDPRVTRVGRFLRRTSLDELPQLFNVLKGDMSLVGPRPELPWLVAEYAPWQWRRLAVPPGITGWWQVNGRADRLMHLHTDVDLYYVSHYSFWLDLWILWKTIWVVLQMKGAH